MSNELVIDVSPSEVTIALLNNKRLMELTREQSDAKFAVGDIYLGKVRKIMPGLNAAFIDVGYEKDAFLHYLDLGHQFQTLDKFRDVTTTHKQPLTSLARITNEPDIPKDGKIGDLLRVNQPVIVQIAKEPISTKGPCLTSEISVAGRNMVLMPFNSKVSVSQKIKSSEERNRLKTLIQQIVPHNYGVIIRTAAKNKKATELDAELQELVARWESTFTKLRKAATPSLILGELNRSISVIRDIYDPSFTSIFCNDAATCSDIRKYIESIAPEKVKTVKHYHGQAPIFTQFGIDKQIKAAFGQTVSFKSGAYVIIEHTEAFHVIDVNSGNRSKAGTDQETNALEVNLAACDEIARQLRLRDMGGIIVIDFIDMHKSANKQLVYERMREAMGTDRTKHNILPLSKFCLMQITRQRVRPVQYVETAETCPACKGTGKVGASILVTDEIENKIDFILGEMKRKGVTIKVHPFVHAFLTKGLWSKKMQLMWKYKRSVKIEPVSTYNYLECHYFDEEENEIIL